MGSATDSDWLNGADLGIGVETLLVGNVSVRAEYNHIFYNAFSTPLSTRISPANNQFVLGLIYHFDPFNKNCITNFAAQILFIFRARCIVNY